MSSREHYIGLDLTLGCGCLRISGEIHRVTLSQAIDHSERLGGSVGWVILAKESLLNIHMYTVRMCICDSDCWSKQGS